MNGRFAGILAVVALAHLAGSAHAQTPYNRRPPFSPYLNLTRPGSTTLNYYGLVRPELDFRNSIAGLQNQVGTLDRAVNDAAQAGPATALPATGHPTVFLNYSRYFPGMGGRSGGRQPAASTVPTAPTTTRPAGSTTALPGGRSSGRPPTAQR